MGQIVYNGTPIKIADFVVAQADSITNHLFREGVSFTMFIEGHDDKGRSLSRSMWMSPQIPIEFVYVDYETTKIPRDLFNEQVRRVTEDGMLFFGDDVPVPWEFSDADTVEVIPE
ncbi:hypothetical protein [Gordonia sp. (in: high G+C Gram-positive bacteria)]|uniref:DUF7882 family protein n=1 Tax=Gordonia sp. (in: high G+C Gram-positive bacteria) TaxID=84139 RepID=UPI003C74679C